MRLKFVSRVLYHITNSTTIGYTGTTGIPLKYQDITQVILAQELSTLACLTTG